MQARSALRIALSEQALKLEDPGRGPSGIPGQSLEHPHIKENARTVSTMHTHVMNRTPKIQSVWARHFHCSCRRYDTALPRGSINPASLERDDAAAPAPPTHANPG